MKIPKGFKKIHEDESLESNGYVLTEVFYNPKTEEIMSLLSGKIQKQDLLDLYGYTEEELNELLNG